MNDFAFKRVFGEPDGARPFVAFLNAILDRPDPIVSIEYENPEIPPNSRLEKTIRLDIAARSDKGDAFDVEVQVEPQSAIHKRTLLYWSRLFEKQSRRGREYDILPPCIAIQILGFPVVQSTNAFHTRYHVREDDQGFRFSDELEIHLLEMPKFRVGPTEWERSFRDPLSKWLLMLQAADNEPLLRQLEVAAMEDPLLKEAMSVWEAASMDDATWKLYNDRDLRMRDFNQYRKDGMTEGMKEGERAKARAIAKAMLSEGESWDRVQRFTGLDQQELETLIKE